ncbi:MAG: RNA polymerase subunit sigma-70, partial [Chloroflexota bacterium]|nr:RNA polymerase subunit sigma-70 [Chloroflexota bacterium]
ALLALLDPDVVLRADHAAVLMSAGRQAAGAPQLTREVRGAATVADTFAGRARFAQPALVNGAVGAMWASGGKPRIVFSFTILRGLIVAMEIIADSARLDQLDVVSLTD